MWENLGLGRKNKHLDKWKARGFQNGQKSQDSADPFECDFKPCVAQAWTAKCLAAPLRKSESSTEAGPKHLGKVQEKPAT